MNNTSQESLTKILLLNSIDREELLIKKYEEYLVSTENNDWKDMLKEFKKMSLNHLDLLKTKLQKFNN